MMLNVCKKANTNHGRCDVPKYLTRIYIYIYTHTYIYNIHMYAHIYTRYPKQKAQAKRGFALVVAALSVWRSFGDH